MLVPIHIHWKPLLMLPFCSLGYHSTPDTRPSGCTAWSSCRWVCPHSVRLSAALKWLFTKKTHMTKPNRRMWSTQTKKTPLLLYHTWHNGRKVTDLMVWSLLGVFRSELWAAQTPQESAFCIWGGWMDKVGQILDLKKVYKYFLRGEVRKFAIGKWLRS